LERKENYLIRTCLFVCLFVFLILVGKADTNAIKTCALHINERLKECNSSDQRFVVVVAVVVVGFVQFTLKNLETDREYQNFYILTDYSLC